MMDIYERLKQDHARQKDLAAKLEDTSGDSEERRKIFAELKSESESHANAEEQVFYAALMEIPETQEKARHGVAEHKTASDLVEELSELDFGSGGWLAKFRKFKDSLEHHIEEEESMVFEAARKALDPASAEGMVADFEARKAAEQ